VSRLHEKHRLGFIDAVRGVAAIMVLLQHGFESAGFVDPFDGFGRSYINFGQVGGVAFFLVSGFVIPLGLERRGSFSDFWIGRVARIYPLYLFLLVLNLLFLNKAGFWGMNFGSMTKLVIAHLLFLQGYIGVPNCVGASWTLSVEMIWYAFFSVIFACGLNKRAMSLIFPLLLSVVFLACFSVVADSRIPLGRLDLLLLCVQGLLAYRLYMEQLDRASFYKLSMLVLIGAMIGQGVAFGYFDHPELTLRSIVLSWILGGALFFIPYVFRNSDLFSNVILKKAGVYSYSIYLVHPFIVDVLEGYGVRGWFGLISVVLLTLIVSVWTYKWIESPAMAFAAGIRRPVSVVQ